MDPIARRTLLTTALGIPALALATPAIAQSRAETLRLVLGGTINTLDPMMFGATREATNFSFCTYDRLLVFGRKQTAQGRHAAGGETRRQVHHPHALDRAVSGTPGDGE